MEPLPTRVHAHGHAIVFHPHEEARFFGPVCFLGFGVGRTEAARQRVSHSLGDRVTVPEPRLVTDDIDPRIRLRSEVGPERELLDASLEFGKGPRVECLEPDSNALGTQTAATNQLEFSERHTKLDASGEDAKSRKAEFPQLVGQDPLEARPDVHESQVGCEGRGVGHGGLRQRFIARQAPKCEPERAKGPRKRRSF